MRRELGLIPEKEEKTRVPERQNKARVGLSKSTGNSTLHTKNSHCLKLATEYSAFVIL